MTSMLGEVRLFAGTYAPEGWALCDGDELGVRDHPELFSVIGTTYGGDGRTSFALPDLRGRVPLGAGQGPNLSNTHLGSKTGLDTRDPRKGTLGMTYIISVKGEYPQRS